nr:8-oxo-dGTP diphosphatase [Neobacillus sp. Marseille-Q6967]
MKYTLCFVVKGEVVLMLLREKEPNKGKWNGVGGKIDPYETPLESCKREVWEETGLNIRNPVFRGIIALDGIESIYVYVCDEFEGEILASNEGILEWKSLNWILTSNEAVENIPLFIEEVLDLQGDLHVYNCCYSAAGEMIDFQKMPLRLIEA